VACSRPAQNPASTYVLVNYRVHEFVEQTAQRVASGVSEMVWDPAAQKFYLSFGSSVGTYANQVAMLDPVLGRITSSTFSGSEPRTLAVSDDGAYLYVGLGGANQVRRFRLPGLTLDATLELGLSANNGSRFANNISVAPGESRTVAITFAENGLVIYDDTVARPQTVDTERYNGVLGTISSITWGRDASVLYAAKNSSFIVFDVKSSGVAMNRSYDNALSTGWIRYFDGLIYTGNGTVLEPDTGSQVGVFQPAGSSVQALAPDTTAGRVYTISRHRSDSGVDGRLITFDAETYVPLRTLQLSLDNSGAKRLLRWGPDGLAMLTNSGDVYLLPVAARRE
jgi:DNA-binding beta-propeller fold protein YncE